MDVVGVDERGVVVSSSILIVGVDVPLLKG